MPNDAFAVRVAGVCALLGASAGLAGAAVGAVHGLGGQALPLGNGTELQWLGQRQASYIAREWLFLAYAVFAVAEGVGLYFLTRRSGSTALWALVAWSAGISIGIVQDAAAVAVVQRLPAEYAAADTTARLAIEPLARTFNSIIEVQQSVANVLLGLGVALYSVAVLRTGAAPQWFALLGFAAAAAGAFFGVVTVSAPDLTGVRTVAEQAFGLVVAWDIAAGIVMLRLREDNCT